MQQEAGEGQPVQSGHVHSLPPSSHQELHMQDDLPIVHPREVNTTMQQNLGQNDSDDEYTECGLCGLSWEKETDEPENWIMCDTCRMWYHWECAGVF